MTYFLSVVLVFGLSFLNRISYNRVTWYTDASYQDIGWDYSLTCLTYIWPRLWPTYIWLGLWPTFFISCIGFQPPIPGINTLVSLLLFMNGMHWFLGSYSWTEPSSLIMIVWFSMFGVFSIFCMQDICLKFVHPINLCCVFLPSYCCKSLKAQNTSRHFCCYATSHPELTDYILWYKYMIIYVDRIVKFVFIINININEMFVSFSFCR